MPRESNQIDRSPDDLLKYPRFDEREIGYRWRVDWWDGPLNGSISYRGVRHWFEFYCDTDEPGNPYYYLVYPLSNEEADFADSWSAENERYRHEYVPLVNNTPAKDLRKAAEVAAKWKVHEELLPDYTAREPVAWFASGANSSFYGVQLQKKP
jgi:hypothetical protein